MVMRIAAQDDMEVLAGYEKHIRKEELASSVRLGRVIVAEEGKKEGEGEREKIIGWLRWNLFWDNTPFMNMLFLLDGYRNRGYGKEMVSDWERRMRDEGHRMVMTSTLASETAQHFYRKLGYVDSGALLLPNEALEIIFIKNFA